MTTALRSMSIRRALPGLLALVACRPKEPTCEPGQVEWGVQLLVEATGSINPDRNGNPLPTVVRVFQVRGELVIDDLDFERLWAAPDAKALGEGFASVQELTIYPGQRDRRLLPVEPDATHVVAAAWFREPVGNTWFATYEIPRRHPEVVCDRAPESHLYPNPCLYVLLDRSATSGGATAPPGFQIVPGVQCAPLGVLPGTAKADGKKKKKKKKKKPKGPQLQLPEGVTDPGGLPSVPQTPSAPSLPSTPSLPSAPQPSVPSTPRT